MLSRALWILLTAPATTSLPEFGGTETALAPYQQRVIDGFYSDYRLDLGRRFYAAYWRCALTERLEIVRCQQDRTRLGDLPLEEHAAAILQLVERYQRYPSVLDPSDLYGEYASLLPQLHREPEIPKYLTLGIDRAAVPDHDMAPPVPGTLGFHYVMTI